MFFIIPDLFFAIPAAFVVIPAQAGIYRVIPNIRRQISYCFFPFFRFRYAKPFLYVLDPDFVLPHVFNQYAVDPCCLF